MYYRSARVFLRDRFAGMLSEIDGGYSFCYDSEYLADSSFPSISLTLPKRKEVYLSKVLFAFFDGLIPEGWLLNVVTHNWKIDMKDRFGLLLLSCKDCIGAVSVEEVRE